MSCATHRAPRNVTSKHDGFLNYHWLMSPADLGRPMVMLEAGINAPAEVVGPDGSQACADRHPVEPMEGRPRDEPVA